MMKKFLAAVTATAMLCAMPVSAADVSVGNDSTTAELKVKYTEGSQKDSYAATIEWGSMEFTYSTAGKTWNTETLTWDTDTNATAGWSAGTAEKAGNIIISNRSSKGIKAVIGFTANDNVDGVTGITVNNSPIVTEGYSIAAAKTGEATTETYTILPTGTYTKTGEDAVTVGKITITLN